MTQHVLSLSELNRATLARQLLLKRAPLPIPHAIEQLAGLNAQASTGPYISLWSRRENFRRDNLRQAIEQREVVQATLMRSTLHLTTGRDYLLLRPALQPVLSRAFRGYFGEEAKQINIERLIQAAHNYITEAPRTLPELRSFLAQVERRFCQSRFRSPRLPVVRPDAVRSVT